MRHHRLDQRHPNPQDALPSSISLDPSITVDSTAAIVFAPSASVLTVVTSTFEHIHTIADGQSVSTETYASTISITDPVQYAAITAAQAPVTSFPSASPQTATASPTAATEKHSPSNMNTLIPSIVVPIVVILLGLFGAFWFFMRRRHRRELKNQPELARAGKGEKLNSRANSGRSGESISYKSTYEKPQPLSIVSEMPSTRSSPLSAPKFSLDDIGVARPLTPRDSETAIPPNQAALREFEPSGPKPSSSRSYAHFSGPRPSTARRPPPSRHGEPEGRNRSNSSPARRGPPPPRPARDPYQPSPGPMSREKIESNLRGGGPIPNMAPGNGLIPDSGKKSTFHSRNVWDAQVFDPDRKAQAPKPREETAPALREPKPAMSQNGRANPPSRIQAPPPGAYNGASPISQYSPIVKETPNIASVASKRAPPPPIMPAALNPNSRSNSPYFTGNNGLTEENMQIARLANSSRLGFSGEPSPKLPPPATRSQLIPEDRIVQSNERYFGQLAAPANPDNQRTSTISAPDDYEDIAAKSDVSSLNELERFDFETPNGGGSGNETEDYFAGLTSDSHTRSGSFGGATANKGTSIRNWLHLQRGALRLFSSPSTLSPFKSSRSISTISPSLLRSPRLTQTIQFQRRWATDEAEPKKENTETPISHIQATPQEEVENAISENNAEAGDKKTTEETVSNQAEPSVVEKITEAASETASSVVDSVKEVASGAFQSNQSQQRPRATVFGEPKPTLYIGNLFFDVTENDLVKEFSRFGTIKSCRLIRDNRGLSKGFGYVDYETTESAAKAIEALNQQLFEGRRLAVQYAAFETKELDKRKAETAAGTKGTLNPPSKTLFIGNMSFEMTDRDLNNLFRGIRNVIDVRVAIDRRTGQPRGFAHADFIDVKSAMEAATVLAEKEPYGRRLRIDYSYNSSNAPRKEPRQQSESQSTETSEPSQS